MERTLLWKFSPRDPHPSHITTSRNWKPTMQTIRGGIFWTENLNNDHIEHAARRQFAVDYQLRVKCCVKIILNFFFVLFCSSTFFFLYDCVYWWNQIMENTFGTFDAYELITIQRFLFYDLMFRYIELKNLVWLNFLKVSF